MAGFYFDYPRDRRVVQLHEVYADEHAHGDDVGLRGDRRQHEDFVGTFGDGDHSDHHAAAYFAQAAQQAYGTSVAFAGYIDYGTVDMPVNVTGADLTAKSNAFYTYAPFDSDQCNLSPQRAPGAITQIGCSASTW